MLAPVQFDKRITLGNVLTIVGGIVALGTALWAGGAELSKIKSEVATEAVVRNIQQDAVEKRLERIEQKVDRLIERRP